MELESEGAATARVLERIPDEHLKWKPHEKSMSLGQLAMHIAMVPSQIASIVAVESYQIDPAVFEHAPEAASRAEVMAALAKSLADAKAYLSGLTPEQAGATWRLTVGDQEVMAAPRAAVIRSIMLNHWYHHRGQMSVYLRLLNVALPSIYGPSADENPFVQPANA